VHVQLHEARALVLGDREAAVDLDQMRDAQLARAPVLAAEATASVEA